MLTEILRRLVPPKETPETQKLREIFRGWGQLFSQQANLGLELVRKKEVVDQNGTFTVRRPDGRDETITLRSGQPVLVKVWDMRSLKFVEVTLGEDPKDKQPIVKKIEANYLPGFPEDISAKLTITSESRPPVGVEVLDTAQTLLNEVSFWRGI